nr:hypothetical protein Iba_chr03bCG0670 [Ipomoea batatas]
MVDEAAVKQKKTELFAAEMLYAVCHSLRQRLTGAYAIRPLLFSCNKLHIVISYQILGATERRPVGASPPATSVGQEARELRKMVRQPEMRYDDCALMHSKMPKRRSGGGTTTGTTVVWVGSSVGTVRIGQYSVREVCRLLGLIDHASTGKY